MSFNPDRLAALYYFGDLQYWKLPKIAADALEHGFDGPLLRRIAGFEGLIASDIPQEQINAAFREMGVDAPVSKADAMLSLAEQAAEDALSGHMSAFDAATYIRVHLCELREPPVLLSRIVKLSHEAETAPRQAWGRLESDLTEAMRQFAER